MSLRPVCFGLAVSIAAVAHAQTPSDEANPTAPPPAVAETEQPGARAVAPSAGESASAPQASAQAEAADAAQYAVAKQYFERGVQFFEAENYEAALTEFERAYQHMEGHKKRFFVLDNIGQCHERLFRYDRAMEYYHRYLKEGGPGAEDRATVEGIIKTLEGLLATVIIKSNVPAEVWVGNRQMGEAPGEVLIPGGRHVIELRARGYESAKKEISIAAREKQSHEFRLDEFYEGISPIYFYSGAVLTAGAIAGGTYFGLKARSEHDAGIRRSQEIDPIANTSEDEERVKRLAVTADIFFASAVVLGVGTTLLYFMTGWDDHEESPMPKAAKLTPFASPQALGLSLEGAF